MLGIGPMAVSLLAIPLALAFAFFVWRHDLILALPFGLLAVLMDFIDGALARETGKGSPLGNYMDAMTDKISEFILVGGFVFWFPLETVAALGCSFLASFAKPRAALVIITDNRDWPGIGERGDRMAVLFAGMLASLAVPLVSGMETMGLALWVLALVSAIGLFQRMAYARKLIREAERKGSLLPYLRARQKKVAG
jgi:phosphatidylglycerophosphate synthase